MKWCAQTFPLIFWIFAIFDRNFAIIVAPPSDENENYVVRLKEQSLLKQEAQLMLTTGSTRLAVSRGQQTWYHFGFIATFR